MRLIKLSILSLTTFFIAIFAFSPSVMAANLFNDACSGGNQTGSSAVCQGRTQVNNPVTGAGSIFEKVINLVTMATGLIAVIVIIVSGIRFASSSGDPNSVTQARNTILYTVVGLAVLLLARSIIVFVLNRL